MAHDCAGFFGVTKTYAALRQQAQVNWPDMWDDDCDYVRACEVCQKRGG